MSKQSLVKILSKVESWKPLSVVSRLFHQNTVTSVRELRFYARPERMKYFSSFGNLVSLEFVTRMQLVVSEHLNISSLTKLKVTLETGGSIYWDSKLGRLEDLTVLISYELTDDDHPFTHDDAQKPSPWQNNFCCLRALTSNIAEPWALGLQAVSSPLMETFRFLPGDYREVDVHGADFFRNLLAMLGQCTCIKRFSIPIFYSDTYAHITNKMVATLWAWLKNVTEPRQITIDFCLEYSSSVDLVENYLTPLSDVLEYSNEDSRSMVKKLAGKQLQTTCSFLHTNTNMHITDNVISLNSDNLSEISFIQTAFPRTKHTTFRMFVRPHTICHDTSCNTIQQVLKEWADKCLSFAQNISEQFTLDIVFMSVSASQINTFGEARQWSDNRRQLISQYALLYDQGYTIPKCFVSDLKIPKYSVTIDYNRVVIKPSK